MTPHSSTPKPHLPRLIQPVDYLAALWQHLTESACQEVFQLLRTHERQRKWSLFALLQVWVGLLSSAARTQTQAVEECGKGYPFFPDVLATPESFFERIQSLRPAFFHSLFLRFTNAILPVCPRNFASFLSLSEKDFPGLFVLDGSKLHKVGRNPVRDIVSVKRGRAHLYETLVTLGEGKAERTPRLIEWKTPKGELRLLTYVMELGKLPADQAVLLYQERWSVERCFLSLKDTLNLNHLFNASPAAVGQQVFATAMLVNALRLAQSEIAKKAGVEPERISPEKLFPRLTDKIVMLTIAEEVAEWQSDKYYRELKRQYANPPEPEAVHLEKRTVFQLRLDGITLEPRLGERRKRRYCKGRRYATSYAKIPGAKKYVRI